MTESLEKKPLFYLASGSPRRRELLASLGLEFLALPVDMEESRQGGESPARMVTRLATEKARRARAMAAEDLPVLAADTVVAMGDRVFGKPVSREDALDMLDQLSGTSHDVYTGVALDLAGNVRESLSVTQVQFRQISRREMIAYWDSGEPADKAGAYAIQGLGATFVRAIRGSYSGVVGLPIFETIALLQQAGIDPLKTAVVDS
jgi:septum formation protein